MYFPGYQQPTYDRPPMGGVYGQVASLQGGGPFGRGGPMPAQPAGGVPNLAPPPPPSGPAPPAGPGGSDAPFNYGNWNIDPVYGGKWSDTQSVRDIIKLMFGHGFMNPYGTPGYRSMYEGAANRASNDAISRAERAADLRGLTPEQAEFARTMAGVSASGGAARGYSDFMMQDALSNRDFMRSLIEKHYGYNYTRTPQ